ncbi:MAG: (Fe-S)-binding protein [Chitinophagia bacterium]|nr:(Fe-S)-binding protein [Chitinophagia bacterium]
MKVQLQIPCFIDQLYPQTAINMVKVLEKAGCVVSYDLAQTCCGQPAYNAGYKDEARHVAQKMVQEFNETDYIVSPSGSCAGYIRNCYMDMLGNSSAHLKTQKIITNVFEFTDFLVNKLNIQNVGASFEAIATYHAACGALRECGIKTSPRLLLQNVKGLQLLEMKDAETCCGFGGTFAIKYEPISIGMAYSKVQNAVNSGAEYIISTDMSCLMHIQGYIDTHHIPLKTIHIADVLAAGWE